MVNAGISAYDEAQNSGLEGRALEAKVMLRAARKLAWCAQNWPLAETKEYRTRLADALDFNQRLWTLLQVEWISPGGHLDEGLKKNLVQLSREVDKRSFTLHSGGELRDLEFLSALNQAIAAGLSENPPSSDKMPESSSVNHVDLTA
jgi:flagellar biosynthesis activator protein FlaF